MKHYLEDYFKPKKLVYQREHQEISQTASDNGFFAKAQELGDQDMCFFGSFLQQIILIKKEMYSLLKHSILVQIIDILAGHN